MEVVILAGGLGTRLRSVVEDVPKCMAPVAGKPFLAHLLDYLEGQFVDHVILSLGYKSEVVIEWLRGKAFTFKISWVIEKVPLGTGGGIQLALQKSTQNEVFVINGDTYFPVSLRSLKAVAATDTALVVALKSMKNFDRYGSVVLNAENDIVAFKEKQPLQEGLINGGTYLLFQNKLNINTYEAPFSFEQQILERVQEKKGAVVAVPFIDIGIPEDYAIAQEMLAI